MGCGTGFGVCYVADFEVGSAYGVANRSGILWHIGPFTRQAGWEKDQECWNPTGDGLWTRRPPRRQDGGAPGEVGAAPWRGRTFSAGRSDLVGR